MASKRQDGPAKSKSVTVFLTEDEYYELMSGAASMHMNIRDFSRYSMGYLCSLSPDVREQISLDFPAPGKGRVAR